MKHSDRFRPLRPARPRPSVRVHPRPDAWKAAWKIVMSDWDRRGDGMDFQVLAFRIGVTLDAWQANGAPDPVRREAARRVLLQYMQALSEECWCAGWMSGLEYALWEAVQTGKPMGYGQGILTVEVIQNLRWLSSEAGGWFHYPPAEADPTFIPAEDWQRLYEAATLTIDRRRV